MPNVKGSAFASRAKWVRFNQGEAGLERLRKHVSPALREVLDDGPAMAKWYPFDCFVELCLAIDELFGKGDMALVKALGRQGADANLTTIYKLFYKMGTVKWLMARAARLWGMHYDSGRLLVVQALGKEVEMIIKDFATPHRAHCLAVEGWAERSVELSGGEDVVTEPLGCRAEGAEGCRFRIIWR